MTRKILLGLLICVIGLTVPAQAIQWRKLNATESIFDRELGKCCVSLLDWSVLTQTLQGAPKASAQDSKVYWNGFTQRVDKRNSIVYLSRVVVGSNNKVKIAEKAVLEFDGTPISYSRIDFSKPPRSQLRTFFDKGALLTETRVAYRRLGLFVLRSFKFLR